MQLFGALAGLVLLGVVILDVFGTVFVPRGGAGVSTRHLYATVWASSSWVSSRSGPHRRAVLALAGPILLPLTVAVWVVGLVTAFTLIYLPYTLQLSVPQGEPGWTAPIYTSAYAATTLGVGDIYATTPLLRLLITVKAGLGFALFSIGITYVLSVYGALLRATALALHITSFIGRQAGEDAVDVVCRSVKTHSEEQTLAWLRQVVSELATTAQAQAQYPLIAYFHIPRDDRALPLALIDLLELLTVCRTLPDPLAYPSLTSGPTLVWAWRLTTTFVLEHADQIPSTDEGATEDSRLGAYLRTRERLMAAGIALRHDDEARSGYLALRGQWSSAGRGLLDHFGYQHRPDA